MRVGEVKFKKLFYYCLYNLKGAMLSMHVQRHLFFQFSDPPLGREQRE